MEPKTAKRLANSVAFGSEYGGGMDTRTYLAGQAMVGQLAFSPAGAEAQSDPDVVARKAVEFADALLAELAKEQQ